MDDLTLCAGVDCPLRLRCFRARSARPARFDQFGRSPYDAQAGACAYFDDLERRAPTREAVRERAFLRWSAAGRPAGDPVGFWLAAEAELNAAFHATLEPLEP